MNARLLTYTPLALLALATLGFTALWASGRLSFGVAAAPTQAGQSARGEPLMDANNSYRMELAPEVSLLLDRSGHLGFWGDSTQEVRAFRYEGGLLDCALEVETAGQTAQGTRIPEAWDNMFEHNPELSKASPAHRSKQGYVVLVTARPSAEQAQVLAPYQPHLGGFLASALGGPHAAAVALRQEVVQPRAYRIFVHAGPLTGSKGAGFNVWSAQVVQLRQPLLADPAPAKEFRLGGGKQLQPEQDFTVLEERHGTTTIRLKARFLSPSQIREFGQLAQLSKKG